MINHDQSWIIGWNSGLHFKTVRWFLSLVLAPHYWTFLQKFLVIHNLDFKSNTFYWKKPLYDCSKLIGCCRPSLVAFLVSGNVTLKEGPTCIIPTVEGRYPLCYKVWDIYDLCTTKPNGLYIMICIAVCMSVCTSLFSSFSKVIGQ